MRCYFCTENSQAQVSITLGSGVATRLAVCQGCAEKEIAIAVDVPREEAQILEALGEVAIRQLRQGDVATLRAAGGAVLRLTRLDHAAFSLARDGVEALVLYRGSGNAPVPVALTASRSNPGLIAGRYNLAAGSIEPHTAQDTARLRACRDSTLRLLVGLASGDGGGRGLRLSGFRSSASEAA